MTSGQELINGWLAEEPGLDELLSIKSLSEISTSRDGDSWLIDAEGIHFLPDWMQSQPPVLFTETIPFDKEHTLGLIFHHFGSDEKAWSYLQHKEVYREVDMVNRLRAGVGISNVQHDENDYRNLHNTAVCCHYGFINQASGNPNPIPFYQKAIQQPPDDEHKAFSMKELATFLLDQQMSKEADGILREAASLVISEAGKQAINLLRVKAGMHQLVLPYDKDELENLKKVLWEAYTYYEAQGQALQEGLLMVDASQLANIAGSYAESLSYIKKAVDIFDREGLTELKGNAMLQRGVLLSNWAQNGNPQFYKTAIESFQQALYVFKKEESPYVFADIQHKLGVLYAEMPSEPKKRSIWAGVSSAAFYEALDFFTKEQYPYEYASVCNNFANAFTKFPKAIHSDNHLKALHYYEEALEIRNVSYPYERAISLLNYLEASWNVGNDESSFNQRRYEDMIAKAQEVKQLVNEPELLATADEHLENLQKLKSIIEKSSTNA
jgi:tetratricopeptide (TPR) repeat protein